MEEDLNRYYKGFEGEPEIIFSTSKKKIHMWSGYFDELFLLFKPKQNGWEGLAYYYHLDEGWYEESPWRIPDIREAYNQFKSIYDEIENSICKELLEDILQILNLAIEDEEAIFISYE